MEGRITGLVSHLNDNDVFVFGSNTAGRHGKGAAKQAMKWGAKYGTGNGIQGNTYGIPTVNGNITGKLSLGKISSYVDEFIEFAKKHTELTFLVTEIGCGLAGWTVSDIAPLFKDAVEIENIRLPHSFWKVLTKK